MRETIRLKEILSFFSCRLVLRETSTEERAIIRRMQNRDTFIKLNVVAFLFCFVQLFFIVSDLLSGFYIRIDYSYFNLMAEVLILLSSVIALAFIHTRQDKEGNQMALAQLVYYLCLETGFLLYLVSDMLRGLMSINNAFFNLIVLAIFTVYNAKALVLLTGYMAGVTLVFVLTIPGMLDWERIQLLPLFLVLLFFCANYFRARNTDRFLAQVRLAAMARQFKDISTRDFLTQLPNRTALDLYLQEEVRAAVAHRQTLGFIMVDIDDFKLYNDFHSHLEGDGCLRDIGQQLGQLSDACFKVFRYGGEEFLIIGIDVQEQALLDLAEAVVRSARALQIQREDRVNEQGYVTVSVGCSMGRLNSLEEYPSLLRLADQALYQAKRQGKDCYFYKGIRYTVAQ